MPTNFNAPPLYPSRDLLVMLKCGFWRGIIEQFSVFIQQEISPSFVVFVLHKDESRWVIIHNVVKSFLKWILPTYFNIFSDDTGVHGDVLGHELN